MENKKIITIKELLSIKNLNIPSYQRPYKWTPKNIADLLEDINTAIQDAKKHKNFKYRIGTIIIHEDKREKKQNIVDRATKNNITSTT